MDDFRVLNTDTQKISRVPILPLQGRTMEFGGKLYRFYESVQEFLKAPDGSIGIFPAYIDKVEQVKKTRYANIGDNISHSFICKGFRKLMSGEWIKFECEPTPRNAYFIYAKRYDEIIGEFHTIAMKQIV